MKEIVVDSLRWLDRENKAATHGFVIMPNHIHILWTYLDEENYDPTHALLSYTAHQFKKRLQTTSPDMLEKYLSTQWDRDYHFWERRSRSVEMPSRLIALQKLYYIHHNPLQEHWKLAEYPEAYQYSSARYYLQIENEFEFLKHYSDF